MKVKYFISLALFSLLLLNCSNKDNIEAFQLTPAAKGEISDMDGNTYAWVRIGQLDWTTSNLRVGKKTTSSKLKRLKKGVSIYVDKEQTPLQEKKQRIENFEKYGMLYTFQAAEDIIPDGWRIPTDEDWQNLEKTIGMKDVMLTGMEKWRGSGQGYTLMQKEGGAHIRLDLAGFYNYINGMSVPESLNLYGYYWTSSKNGEMGIYRKLSYYQRGIWRGKTLMEKRMSIRIVRNAEK